MIGILTPFGHGKQYPQLVQGTAKDFLNASRNPEIVSNSSLVRVLIPELFADSIFSVTYPIDSLRFIPYSKNEFFLAAAKIETASKVKVNVFEAHVLNSILLHGLNKQLIINYSAEREKITGFKGLQVGSLEEATNNAGNWE